MFVLRKSRNSKIILYLDKRKIGFVFRNFDVDRKICRRDERNQKSVKENEILLFKNFNIRKY